MKSFILLFLISFIPSVLFGKIAGTVGGSGHSGDIVRVLGLNISNKAQKELAISITDGVKKYIDDDAEDLQEKIQSVNPAFSWGLYTHRIFFHWGFNSDPKESKAISNCLDRCEASSKERSIIWEMIITEQQRRNGEMEKVIEAAIEKKMGRPINIPKQINALASIVYDVHIIGDFIEGKDLSQRAIEPLDLVVADLINASRKLKCTDHKKINNFKRDLNRAAHGSALPSENAKNVLSVLEEQIPSLLKSSPLKAVLY